MLEALSKRKLAPNPDEANFILLRDGKRVPKSRKSKRSVTRWYMCLRHGKATPGVYSFQNGKGLAEEVEEGPRSCGLGSPFRDRQ